MTLDWCNLQVISEDGFPAQIRLCALSHIYVQISMENCFRGFTTSMMIRPKGSVACYMAAHNFGGNSEQKLAVGGSVLDPRP